MARVIKFDGRRVTVPDDATDEEIAGILEGGSAPAAATSAAAAPIPVADPGLPVPGTPGAGTNEQAPDLISTIMGGVNYGARTGAIVADKFGEGAANLVGLPVDLINAAPMLANLIPGVSGVGPLSADPVGGSKTFNDLRKGFGLIPDAPAPTDAFQTVAGRVGQELGGAAVPVGGILAKAGRMGVEAIRESGPLSRMFLEQAAVDPAKFVGKEAAAAVAAGTGAGTANLMVDPNTPGGQAADMAGAFAGAGIAGLGEVVLRGTGNVFNALRNNPKYVDQTVKDAVVDRLAKAADVPGTEGAGGVANVDPLIAQIMDQVPSDRPSSVIPGFQESLADRTANPGIAALEYSRQTGPNAGKFAGRRSANAAVVDDAMTAIEPTETPGVFRSALDEQRDIRLRAAADRTNDTQNEFERYIQTLVPQTDAETRGATVRSGVVDAEQAARDRENALWRAITGEVDPAPLADTMDQTRVGLTEARRQSVADLNSTVDIPRGFVQPTELPEGVTPEMVNAERQWKELTGGSVDEIPPEVDPIDMQELLDMRSTLLKEQRDARSAGDRNRTEAVGRFIDEINGYLASDAVDEGTRRQIDAARNVSRQVNEDFNRPNDPLADVLRTREGRPDVPDSGVAKKFIQPDSGQASNIDRLLSQTDRGSRAASVREALKDEILAGVDKGAMVSDPARLDQYLNQYGRVFERFPELRDEIRQAANAGRQFDAASSAQADLQADVGTPDGSVRGRGTVGKYLEFSDANSERAIGEVLASKDPGAAADELMTFIGDNPRGVEGARSAFWQKLRTESTSVDNAQRSMGGKRAWRGDWLKSFLDKPATAAVVERLYRDNPEQLETIRRYAEVLDNVDLRQRGKATGTSGTAQGVTPILTPETLQSRFYAYMRGQVSGTYLATSIAAVIARRAVRRAQTTAIETLTDKVLLDPEEAAILLRENNPANRAALARKAKGWLGNEASTLVELLDGEDDGPADDQVQK